MLKQGQALSGASNRAERRRMKRAARTASAPHSSEHGKQNVAALLQMAEGMRARGKLDEAGNICRQIVQDNPDQAHAYIALATILEQQNRYQEAYQCFKQAVTLAPQDFLAWRRFGRCLFKLQQFDAALIAFKKALGLKPDHLATLIYVGRTLHNLERPEDALAIFDAAIERDPANSHAFHQKGIQHQTLGDFANARAAFERAVDLNPKLIESHFRLAAMGETIDEMEQSIQRLRKLAVDNALDEEQRAGAYFAAARLLHKQKRSQDAFELYREGNDVLRAIGEYNPGALSSVVDLSIASFTPEVFETLNDAGTGTDAPIFIIGMPRSGTTLVEQIISSHPEVGAGGEERKMTQLVEALLRNTSGGLRYPADVSRIEPQQLTPIGDQYLSHMRGRFADDARFTDKNPFNFFHAGLISILFPNASIVHCHRDPMDTCLSCYFQYFGDVKTLSFTNDLEHLGHFYTEYQRIMAHWHAVLPGRILDVRYEDMIADQESISRAIIAHLGLRWDDACLKFNENERGVLTASQMQVRQPIYKSSVGRWREFEEELAPLKQVIDNAA